MPELPEGYRVVQKGGGGAPAIPEGFRIVTPADEMPEQDYLDAPDLAGTDIARRTDRVAAERKAAKEEYLGEQTWPERIGTFAENFVEGVPALGPLAQRGGDFLMSETVGRMQGYEPEMVRNVLEERRAVRDEKYPVTSVAGNVAGTLWAVKKLSDMPGGNRALGLEGTLPQRTVASAASAGTITLADALARGENLDDATRQGAIAAGIGGVFPGLGAGASFLGRTAYNALRPFVQGAVDPVKEASKRVALSFERDRRGGNMLMPEDELAAANNNQQLLNVDRGGETTRALTRSVANQSPEARGLIERTASDRFASQGTRAREFITRLVGGEVDDIGYRETIRETAERANTPAYRKAYEAPAAQQVWNRDLQDLLQSDAVQKAIGQVGARSSNRAAVSGEVPIRNPFKQSKIDGRYRLVQQADGTTVSPNLAFWDQVKRNLDSQLDAARGDRTLTADLMAIKSKLTKTLDDLVPAYKEARAGAYEFFQAEDAVEAGRKFFNNPKSIPEATKAYSRLKTPQKDAFSVGFTSELLDTIKAAGDRRNVINQVFGSQARREQIELALGKDKARQVEQFVRIETVMDQLRGAMGNSTTARQLVELGIGAGGGLAVTGGDWRGAIGGAGLIRLARYGGSKINERTMKQVADILLSDDPKVLQDALEMGTLSPKKMQAIEDMSRALAIISRGAAIGIATD